VRYLEWTWDPDPRDTLFRSDYAYLLRDADGSVRCVHDVHEMGLFPRERWLSLLADVGFSGRSIPLDIGDEGQVYEGFFAQK
jgi:hypothetical protein